MLLPPLSLFSQIRLLAFVDIDCPFKCKLFLLLSLFGYFTFLPVHSIRPTTCIVAVHLFECPFYRNSFAFIWVDRCKLPINIENSHLSSPSPHLMILHNCPVILQLITIEGTNIITRDPIGISYIAVLCSIFFHV